MPTANIIYDASHVRDYNTTAFDPGVSQTITANPRVPLRYLTNDAGATVPASAGYGSATVQGSGVITDVSQVTQLKFNFQVDSDNEVIPGSYIDIFYRLEGESLWRNFYDDTDLAEAGYDRYQALFDDGVDAVADPADWLAIGAFNADNGNVTAFVLADDAPVVSGQTFTTDDPINPADPVGSFATMDNEFLGGPVCFTTGMALETDRGDVAVDDLKIGDMVRTFDNGYQPIRFIYKRKMPALANLRPIVFEKGAIGNSERLIVSQQHRFLISALPAEIRRVFGRYQNNLVKALALINGSTIRIMTELDEVEYFHIMFEKHELVYSYGTISESWQPHRRNLKRDQALREELLEIFPEIRHKGPKTGGGPVRQEVFLKIMPKIPTHVN